MDETDVLSIAHLLPVTPIPNGQHPPPLLPQHQKLVDASGISPRVAAARGYRSLTRKVELKELGFGEAQRRVPALLVPLHDVRGEVAGYQARPDSPRMRDGKPAKYETPSEAPMVLDVNPLARPWLGDPQRPLFITEGVRKADCAVSRGLCCIALLGVWNWRGTNSNGGRTALPDWETIALNGRPVYLCFDSDVALKPEVHAAQVRLKSFLEKRGAEVAVIYLPPGEGGAKCGLDDFLAAGRTLQELLALAAPEVRPIGRSASSTGTLPDADEEEAEPGSYRQTAAGILWYKPLGGGAVATPLTNFCAQIVTDIIADDGAECTRLFEIKAGRNGHMESFRVPSREFASMNWATERLGAEAMVFPGMGLRDHARAAVQILSLPIPSRTIYTHTGWRRVKDQWVFLHAGGAIGAEDVEVVLENSLTRYRLDGDPDTSSLAESVRRSLAFLQIAPLCQTWPLLAACYLAPLGEVIALDFVPWVKGDTGWRKSSVAGLVLNHFGSFDHHTLPTNFSSTPNAVEALLFAGKDVPVVVDDYAPAPDQRTEHNRDAVANRLLRGIGDHNPRHRATATGGLQGEKRPRCLPIVTAELDPPGVQSAAARAFLIDWTRDSVHLQQLHHAQQSDPPAYRQAMAGYICWLAPQIDRLRRTLPEQVNAIRFSIPASHGRIQTTTAKLLLAVRLFLDYAVEVRAIDGAELERHEADAREALYTCAERTGRCHITRKPTLLFLDYLRALLEQGRAFLADRATDTTVETLAPNAVKVGWIDEEDALVYLHPTIAHREVNLFSQGASVRFPVSKDKLGEQLNSEGLLLRTTTEKVKGREAPITRNTYRIKIIEKPQWVWCLAKDTLFPRDGNDGNDGNEGSLSPDFVPGETLPEAGFGSHQSPEMGTGVGTGEQGSPNPGLDKGPGSHTGSHSAATMGTAAAAEEDEYRHETALSASPVPAVPTVPTSEIQDPLPSPAYVCVFSESGLESVMAALIDAPAVALDTETTGLSPRKDRLRLLTLATTTGTWIIDGDRVSPRPLFPLLMDKPIVCHNATFDLGFLAALGFEPDPRMVRDTMMMSQILHAGDGARHNLAEVVKRELGLEVSKELQTSDWTGDLTPAQLEYAARDAAVLLPLLDRLEEQIRAAGLENVAEIEARCIPAVVWMENAGAGFDGEAWQALTREAGAEVQRLRAELDAAAPAPPGLDLGLGWRWESAAIARRALREAGCDLPNTSDETLAACNHPLAALLRQYRAATKLLSSYGESWLAHVTEGRIYAQWRQLGSAAGRMSCQKPNLQQVPRDRRYRACIVAPPGRVLVKADYSQIELRIAARIANERRMLAAYRNGDDLHTLTARQILGKTEVSKEDRQLAKAVNFGLLYGMGAEGFRTYAETQFGVELTPEEAERYRTAFFEAYPGLARWHRQVRKQQVMETRTLTGRRRLLRVDTPDTHRLNTPVQGTGADGLKRALALLWVRRVECPGAVPILACHDELVVECDPEQVEAVSAWLVQAMKDGMEPLIHPVPVEVETQIGTTWAGN